MKLKKDLLRMKGVLKVSFVFVPVLFLVVWL